MSPDFYQYYPRLFSNYFSPVKEDTVKDLSDAGYFYYQSVLYTDSLIDDKDFSIVPQIQKCQESSVKLLTSIFGKDSEFWEYWEKRRVEYFEAVKIEKKLNHNHTISLNDYEQLADKKSAFGKVAIDSMWLLSGRQSSKSYEKLLLSHYYFSVGFQLYDDVKDFSTDLEKGQFNWAVTKLKETVNFKEFDNSTLNKLLFLKNIGQNVLRGSISYFEKSIHILLETGIKSEWLEINKNMKSTIEHYLDVTNGYILTLEKKMEVEKGKSKKKNFIDFEAIKEPVLLNGIAFIQKDFEKNFAELKHYMYLSQREGFVNPQQVHYSDTFQRAMLNDCVFYISDKFGLDSKNYFKSEIKYLIERVNKDGIGAWSYFPSVKEIAADIDDLGQIMQIFIKLGRNDLIEKYCTKAIDIVLTDRTQSNGGVETWIIPKNNMSEIQKNQEYFNTTKWGKGPDLEVVANFIYALCLFDFQKHETYIKNAVSYIINQQNEEGFWGSRWYYGKYYGTYVCLRLLKELDNNSTEAIKKATNFLKKSQNQDGGFFSQDSACSNPLNTSFALMSLNLFNDTVDLNEQIRKARLFLTQSQKPDGSWGESPFIKPKAQEPYKSKTLTTALVLKALC